MLTDEHMREGLSRAYIQAVASRAGYNCSLREFDYGIDGTFNEVGRVGKNYVESGVSLDFQAKASSSENLVAVNATTVRYDLECKAQRALSMNSRTPRILILLVLDRDDSKWLTANEKAQVLRRCAWWTSLRGQTPVQGDGRIRIQIPRVQRFDVVALQAMMQVAQSGGYP